MDIQEKEVLIAEIERFKEEAMKSYVVSCWAESYTNTDPFGYVVLENENNKVWWLKTQAYQLWEMWQAAKAQAVPEGFVLVEKSKIESWYLDDYEGMYTDEPDNFLSELDIGDVQAVKRKDYLIIDERTLYAARPWNKNDEAADCWEFYESKDEADLVAKNCIQSWNGAETQEQSNV